MWYFIIAALFGLIMIWVRIYQNESPKSDVNLSFEKSSKAMQLIKKIYFSSSNIQLIIKNPKTGRKISEVDEALKLLSDHSLEGNLMYKLDMTIVVQKQEQKKISFIALVDTNGYPNCKFNNYLFSLYIMNIDSHNLAILEEIERSI